MAQLFVGLAQAQTSDVERYLTAAARLYESLEYERALEQLKRARSSSSGINDDISIALYEGIILAEMGKKEESTAAFKEGLFLNVDAKLPVKVSPKVERDFEVVRQDVKKEMAPIIAKREAEQRAREAQAQAAAKAADEKAAADKAGAAKVAADRAAADRAAAERERARSAAKEREAAAKLAAKTPDVPTNETRVIGALPADPAASTAGGLSPEVTSARAEKKTPVLPFVFGGVAVAAAGAGSYFGIQSRNSVEAYHAAEFQRDAVPHLEAARGPALAANVLFAVAGTAAVGALISMVAGGGDHAPADEASATR